MQKILTGRGTVGHLIHGTVFSCSDTKG